MPIPNTVYPMVTPQFKVGQKVSWKKQTLPSDQTPYVIITVIPVYEKHSILNNLSGVFRKHGRPQIINYIYRCKSSYEMRDFLEGELSDQIPVYSHEHCI
jgi:hypothetical protein